MGADRQAAAKLLVLLQRRYWTLGKAFKLAFELTAIVD